MTWEEAERMMAFIREQQARTNAALARLNKRLNRPIDTRLKGPTSKIDDTAERAWALLATIKHGRGIRKFDERLTVLLNIVERYTSAGRNGEL